MFSARDYYTQNYQRLQAGLSSTTLLLEAKLSVAMEILDITSFKDIQDIHHSRPSIQKEIFTKKYKKRALLMHPDKHPEEKDIAEHLFKLLGEAYDFLNRCVDYHLLPSQPMPTENNSTATSSFSEPVEIPDLTPDISQLIEKAFATSNGGAWIKYNKKQQIQTYLKTISAKVAKLQHYFVTPDTADKFVSIKMQTNQVWIFDDFNSGFKTPIRDLYKAAVLNAHEQGGIVFVTSQHSFDKLSREVHVGEQEHYQRFQRRGKELFGLRIPLSRDQQLLTNQEEKHTHEAIKLSKLQRLLKEKPAVFTAAVCKQLVKGHPKLRIEPPLNFNVEYIEPTRLDDLLIDLQFYIRHPNIALENICCRLNNYFPDLDSPQTEKQNEMLQTAYRVTNPEHLHEKRGAFLEGNPGIGKTHIAIAVTKELIRAGFETYFVTPETAKQFKGKKMQANQIWIFDDLNNGHQYPMADLYKLAVQNGHELGGMVFATSNSTFQLVAEQTHVTDQHHLPRFLRRAEELFGMRHPLANQPKQFSATENEYYTHDANKLKILRILLENNLSLITPAFCEQIQIGHPKLKMPNNFEFDVTCMEPRNVDDLILDLQFYLKNPSIPLENLCCRLNNYSDIQPLQKDLKRIALNVVNKKNLTEKSGAFLQGTPGIGKTHLAIAIAKEFLFAGFETFYMTPETAKRYEGKAMGTRQVWIFDDLNSGYQHPIAKLFVAAVRNANINRGIVFVTSNSTIEEIIGQAMSTEQFMDIAKKALPEFTAIATKLFYVNHSPAASLARIGTFATPAIEGSLQLTQALGQNRLCMRDELLKKYQRSDPVLPSVDVCFSRAAADGNVSDLGALYLQFNISINAITENGNTACDSAREKGHTAAANLIQSLGGKSSVDLSNDSQEGKDDRKSQYSVLTHENQNSYCRVM
jgi:DNA replication protein DnaC